jgi:CBS domain-containing protein
VRQIDSTTPTLGPSHGLPEALSLENVLSRRRSARRFTARALSQDELLQLCWAAQGVTHPEGYRTAPGADALDALALMTRTGQPRLLVRRDGQLAGMVTARDLLDFVAVKVELEP